MGKQDPVGEGGKESGSVVGGWYGQFLWEAYMSGVWHGAKVKYDLAKTQSSWVDNKKKEKLVYMCKSKFVYFVYCSAILSRKKYNKCL